MLQENVFIEKMLPGLTQKHLSEEEMTEYRRPFSQPGEGRLPTVVWPRDFLLTVIQRM